VFCQGFFPTGCLTPTGHQTEVTEESVIIPPHSSHTPPPFRTRRLENSICGHNVFYSFTIGRAPLGLRRGNYRNAILINFGGERYLCRIFVRNRFRLRKHVKMAFDLAGKVLGLNLQSSLFGSPIKFLFNVWETVLKWESFQDLLTKL